MDMIDNSTLERIDKETNNVFPHQYIHEHISTCRESNARVYNKEKGRDAIIQDVVVKNMNSRMVDPTTRQSKYNTVKMEAKGEKERGEKRREATAHDGCDGDDDGPSAAPDESKPPGTCNASGNFNGAAGVDSNFSSFSPFSTRSISSRVSVSYSISALVRSSSSSRFSARILLARARASSTRRRTSASISCLVSEERRL